MSNLSDIKRHISAVEQTRKITKAMETVSSSRMRRVSSHIEYNKRYFAFIRNAMREVLESSEGFDHPYLREPENPRKTFMVFAADKGLAGDYNAKVLHLADTLIDSNPGCAIISIGNVADEHFHKRGRIPDISMLGIVQDPTMKSARRVSREIMKLIDDDMTDEITAVYTSFYGSTKGEATYLRLLPIEKEDYTNIAGIDESEIMHEEIEYTPSRRDVFNEIVPQYLIGLIFGIMVQAYAGEHYARMNAMHSSTDNANDMLKKLQSQYNLARQTSITNEIAETFGAAEVLKSK